MRIKDPILLALFEPYVRRSLTALADSARGAVERPDDPEQLHDLRVSCRRLRQALRLLRPAVGKTRLKKWRDMIAALTKAVGPARDLDVQRQMLKQLQGRGRRGAASSGAFSGPFPDVAQALAQKRMRLQGAVVAAIAAAGPQLAGLTRHWQQALPRIAHAQWLWKAQRRALEEVLEKRGKAPPWPQRLREYAQQALDQQCREILALQAAAQPLAAVSQRHQLRCRVRRLRYSLEMFAPLYHAGVSAQLRQLKRLQDALGQLHDLDVWVTQLLPAWRKRLAKGELTTLQQQLESRRLQLHGRLLRLFGEFTQQRFWGQWSDAV